MLARMLVVTLIGTLAGGYITVPIEVRRCHTASYTQPPSTGLVYLRLGRRTGPEAMSSIMGCLYWSCFVIALLPFTSQSTFLYDRSFFQVTNNTATRRGC